MKTIAIHQPNFLPWFGFFEKIKRVDQFVFLDHVPFSKGSYTNRVKYFCKSSQKNKWLTVPVKNAPLGTAILDIKLAESSKWESKLIHTLQQNIDHPLMELICDTIKNRRTENLADLNISLIKVVMNHLKINCALVRSSTMELENSADQEVLKISKYLLADSYVSGIGGKAYLDEGAFAQNEIEVELLDFKEILVGEKGVAKDLVGLTGVYVI